MTDTDQTPWEMVEAAYVDTRRKAMKTTSPDAPLVGLALSGGGIRAATFSLGVLKSLSALGLIHRFDYLSTVSGGGYIGAFYASLFTSGAARGRAPGADDAAGNNVVDVPDPLGSVRGQAAIGHLRENGRYLLPKGAGDAIRLATTAVRSWAAIQLVIGVTLLALLLCGKAVQAALIDSKLLRDLDRWFAMSNFPTWTSPSLWLSGYPVGDNLLLSPLWPLSGMIIAAAIAMAWGYWLPRYDTVPRWRIARFLGPSGIGTAAIAGACLYKPPGTHGFALAFQAIGVLATGAILVFVAAELSSAGVDARGGTPHAATLGQRRSEEDRVRNRITRWTARTCTVAAAFGALALIDTIGQTVYSLYLRDGGNGAAEPFAAGALIIAAIPLVRQVITWGQTKGSFGSILRRFGHLIALVAALILALVLTSFWSVVAEYLAWRGGPIGGWHGLIGSEEGPEKIAWSLGVLAAGFVLAAAAIGISIGFLNLSSFSAFYAGRLRRAYLGASNPDRTEARIATDRDDQGDDISLTDYYVPSSGAPLHLINVTVNETMGSGSAVVQRDRKGRPLTLSPAGFLVPDNDGTIIRYPLSGPENASGNRAELPLSSWVAISGAAMSTGLGRNTSLGLALLAGLSNLRLGVWWSPPGDGAWKILDPRRWVQRFLAAEFLGRFAGINGSRWYLTDGGHFENTGVYELVRRRVPLIVACDTGADPDYDFADVVNLTRKLRIDFNADLDFLPASKLDLLFGDDGPNRAIFGELSQLVRLSKQRSSRGPYAAIGRIRIPGATYLGTLILLKPRLSGLEMVDLLDYQRINQDFPQQTTGDQFFDEAQWESHFRLGATIAELAFTPALLTPAPLPPRTTHSKQQPPPPPRWDPAALAPIDSNTFDWFADPWLGGAATPTRDQAANPASDTAGAPPRPLQAGATGAASASSANLQDALGATASRIGTSKMIAGAGAAIGSVGLASGLGLSIGNAATPQSPVQTTDTGTGKVPPTGTTVTMADVIAKDTERRDTVQMQITLLEIAKQLQSAIDRIPPKDPVRPADDRMLDELKAIRSAISNTRDRSQLSALVASLERMSQLMDQAVRLDGPRDQRLMNIQQRLTDLTAEVRDSGPRRNVRSGK